MNAIECRNLTKRYEGFTLDHVSFSLPAGSILGLVGENGAGKSTTLRLLMDAIRRDDGTVSILGTDNQSPDFLAVKQEIGVVLDEACLPESLNPRELGRMMALTYANWDQEAYEGYLSRFDLPEKKQLKTFSKGMRMKQALALALSHRARLLILDEATSGLDPMMRDEILTVLEDYTRAEDHSVIFSSHIVSDLEKLCDYVAFLHKGQLILFEEKDRLLEDYALVKLTGVQLESLDPAAVAGKRRSPYGAEALLKREMLPPGFTPEHTTLEDIILFLAREEG